MKETVITAAVPAIPTWVKSDGGAAADAVARGLGCCPWKLILKGGGRSLICFLACGDAKRETVGRVEMMLVMGPADKSGSCE